MTWILTHSGKRLDLLSPDPDVITAFDIAHALARINRFTGHTKVAYTVAEHSIRVAALVDPEWRLQALLHDAAEAYIGDISSPLKALLPAFAQIEHGIHHAICQRFGIGSALHPSIKQADLIMLATERRDLMPVHPDSWECLEGITPAPETIHPMPAEIVRIEFLNLLFDELAMRDAA